MRANIAARLDANWWQKNKAKTLKGSGGQHLTRALRGLETRLLRHNRNDAEPYRDIINALDQVERARQRTLTQECNRLIHRETIAVLEKLHAFILWMRTEATALWNIDAAFNLMLMFLHSNSPGYPIGLIPFLANLNAGTDLERQQNLPLVRLKFNDMVDTRLQLLRNTVNDNRGNLDTEYRPRLDAGLLQAMNAALPIGGQITTAENAINAPQRQQAYLALTQSVVAVSHGIEQTRLALKDRFVRQCRRMR